MTCLNIPYQSWSCNQDLCGKFRFSMFNVEWTNRFWEIRNSSTQSWDVAILRKQDWIIFAQFSAFYLEIEQKCFNLTFLKLQLLRFGLIDFRFLKSCGSGRLWDICFLSRRHNSCKQKFCVTKYTYFFSTMYLCTVPVIWMKRKLIYHRRISLFCIRNFQQL